VFLANIQYRDDLFEGFFFIGSDVNRQFRIGFEISHERTFQILDCEFAAFELIVTVRGDLNGPNILPFGWLGILSAAYRQIQPDALLQKRSGNDENDQKNEGQIEQGGDVDIIKSDQLVALGKAAHGGLPEAGEANIAEQNDQSKSQAEANDEEEDLNRGNVPHHLDQLARMVLEKAPVQTAAALLAARHDAFVAGTAVNAGHKKMAAAPCAGAFAGRV
jgi:hypothetical protein